MGEGFDSEPHFLGSKSKKTDLQLLEIVKHLHQQKANVDGVIINNYEANNKKDISRIIDFTELNLDYTLLL